ncbi:hypothetical protein DS884_00475 [Tenacibaculum sp. E3R01]|uniref:hypothetical protein n=1 Tax=Tenacibaculum sp. E3R01 TaxID=2267227 RepID=UPI000DE966A5|nr:hypothetical protein [Tenacibaculum sp. E3R01]RBW63181.1 hypothetical protein DS884_00475 [Tenacibaculum sp. E3R01]
MEKEIIEAKEFVKILKGDYLNSEHVYSKFYNSVYYDETNDDISFIELSDLKIKGVIDIENIIFNYHITFYDLEIDKLIVNGVEFYNNFIINDSTFNKIIISRSSFKSLVFNECDIDTLSFIDNRKSELIEFMSSKLNLASFYGGYFNKISIFDSIIKNKLILDNSKRELFSFIGILDIYKSQTTHLLIQDIYLNSLTTNQLTIDDSMLINSVYLFSLEFDNLKNNGNIHISGITFLKHSKFVENISIKEYFKRKQFSEEDIKSILKYHKKRYRESLSLEDFMYLLPRIENKLLKLSRYIDFEDFFIEKLSELSFLSIIDCDFGNTRFSNLNLEEINRISISSKLSSISTYNTIFPPNKFDGKNIELYEVFNDLYSVAKNKNNKREEVLYYRKAQDSLLKSFNPKTELVKNFNDITSLAISNLYSAYGTSWLRSFFIVTPIIAFIFFLVMLLTSNYDLAFSTDGFSDNIANFFKFLNPTHRLNFMDTEFYNYSNNTWFIIFDLLGRIFVGIGIFETIKSFRKYSRK